MVWKTEALIDTLEIELQIILIFYGGFVLHTYYDSTDKWRSTGTWQISFKISAHCITFMFNFQSLWMLSWSQSVNFLVCVFNANCNSSTVTSKEYTKCGQATKYSQSWRITILGFGGWFFFFSVWLVVDCSDRSWTSNIVKSLVNIVLNKYFLCKQLKD